MLRLSRFFVVVSFIAWCSSISQGAYTLTKLPYPETPGGDRWSPTSVSKSGDVIGSGTDGTGAIWRKSSGYAFELLPDPAIAFAGDSIVTYSETAGGRVTSPSGEVTLLAFTPVSASDGGIVGFDDYGPVYWNGSQAIPILNGAGNRITGVVTDINNAGAIVGTDDFNQGYIYKDGAFQYLEGYVGASSLRIDDDGRVYGAGRPDPALYGGVYALVWDEDGSICANLGIANGGYARAIGTTPSGVMAYWSGRTLPYCAIRTATGMIEVLELSGEYDIPFSIVTDLDASGYIVGTAFDYSQGEGFSYLLTPTPEPRLALFVPLGLLLLCTRRQRPEHATAR